MLEVGKDNIVEGNFYVLGAVRIDGRLDGSVACDTLLIGRDGLLVGDAFAGDVVIEGQVIGRVTAERVDLRPGAIIEGDVVHERLIMDATASLIGECSHQSRITMPESFQWLKDRNQRDAAEIENLHTVHLQRQAEGLSRAWSAYQALRARFPYSA